jgi:hypothetical protein
MVDAVTLTNEGAHSLAEYAIKTLSIGPPSRWHLPFQSPKGLGGAVRPIVTLVNLPVNLNGTS